LTIANKSGNNHENDRIEEGIEGRYDEYGNELEATWTDVYDTCCVHVKDGWEDLLGGIAAVCFFLYFFWFSLSLVSTSAQIVTGCRGEVLWDRDFNPVSSLMVGIVASALTQSSPATSSIIVALVGSVISVRQGIYMVMGVNIGTTITNTIVAVAQFTNAEMLERAFTGATVHDMFNFLTVLILFPLELATGYVCKLTKACVKHATPTKRGYWQGPIKRIVAPLRDRILIADSAVLRSIAHGRTSCDNGAGLYPTTCLGSPSYEACKSGLIGCSSQSSRCPAFFTPNASAKDDIVSGAVVLFMALCIAFICLLGLIFVMHKGMSNTPARVLHKATQVNGYVAMSLGCLATIVFQSSSLITSTLTPLMGVGLIQLEQMYPLTLGANLGASLAAIMAAMAIDGTASLQIALAHLFFNGTGILIFYPIPYLRNIPMNLSRHMGKLTRIWSGFPLWYIASVFFIIPFMFLGLSALFQKHAKGHTALGVILTLLLAYGTVYFLYWYQYRDGYAQVVAWMQKREQRKVALRTLTSDLEYVRLAVTRLKQHTGCVSKDDRRRPQIGDEIQIVMNADVDIERLSDH
jgi:solute carrier family 34 (sodium-dependent phosphate cotransporter)